MTEKTCGQCIHFHEFNCRRFPPVAMFYTQLNPYSEKMEMLHSWGYPEVSDIERACGEFKQREAG